MDKRCIKIQEHTRKKVADIVEKIAEKDLVKRGDLFNFAKKFNGDFRAVIEFFTFLTELNPEYYNKFEDDFADIVKYMTGPTNTGCIGFYPYLFEIFIIKNKNIVSDKIKVMIKKFIDKYYDWSVNDAYDFVGVNDNTPAMIMTQLYLYGELYGDKNAEEIALKRLCQFEEMLKTRTFISEFSSPSYSPITVRAFAALAELCNNGDVKKRALKCEEEVIRQLFKMYNKHTGTIAGPYSRAYPHDSRAGKTQISELFYCILGEYAPYDIIDNWFADGVSDELYYCAEQLSAYATFNYDFPFEIIEDTLNKQTPYSVCGDAYVSSSHDYHLLKEYNGEEGIVGEDLSMLAKTDNLEEYPCAVTYINTYFTDWYTLGTCTKEFHCGSQTDSLQIGVWDKEKIERVSDAATVFTRMTINGSDAECGRRIVCSEKSSALLAYMPKTTVQDIKSIKMSFLTHYKFDDNTGLYYDGRRIKENERFVWNKTVYFKFKKCYVAVIPPKDGTLAATFERINNNWAFSVMYYEGDVKHFYKKELKLVQAGAAVEVGSLAEYGAFEKFCEKFDSAVYKDRLYTNLHLRYTFEREIEYTAGENLHMCISPVSEGIKYITANGRKIV